MTIRARLLVRSPLACHVALDVDYFQACRRRTQLARPLIRGVFFLWVVVQHASSRRYSWTRTARCVREAQPCRMPTVPADGSHRVPPTLSDGFFVGLFVQATRRGSLVQIRPSSTGRHCLFIFSLVNAPKVVFRNHHGAVETRVERGRRNDSHGIT